jgi:uncharacterized membrane protein
VSEGTARAGVAALALVGAAVSGYLVWARYADAELLCRTGGCETVQSSPYAEVAGIPVAALGLVAYVLIGATALNPSVTARVLGAALALAAFSFSAYLLVIQLAVIGEVCDWCLASDAIASLLAAAATLRLRTALTPARPA